MSSCFGFPLLCGRGAGQGKGTGAAKKGIHFALIGIDNAGKSTLLANFTKEPLETIAPTVGSGEASFKFKGKALTIFDLGGGKSIRDIWTHYFAEVHGLIFVIDASDKTRLEETAQIFKTTLEHEFVKGKSVLILANKQDNADVLPSDQISQALGLTDHLNYSLKACTANNPAKKKKIDKEIVAGLTWLVQAVQFDMKDLEPRIALDVKRQEEIEQERKLAVKKMRQEAREKAEREKAEKEEQEKEMNSTSNSEDNDQKKLNNLVSDEPSSNMTQNTVQDPFVPQNESTLVGASSDQVRPFSMHEDEESSPVIEKQPLSSKTVGNWMELQDPQLGPPSPNRPPISPANSAKKKKYKKNKIVPEIIDA